MKTYNINGYKYIRDLFYIIHQVDPDKFEYGSNYLKCYDSDNYKKNSDALMKIRYDFVKSILPTNKPYSLLDYGYGNGDFLKYVNKVDSSFVLHGYDISKNVDLENVNLDASPFSRFDIITFFDSLEHVPDLDFMYDIDAKFIIISLPECPGINKLNEWKHLKPNEHLHHFNINSLINYMSYYNYEYIIGNHEEDKIRKPLNGDKVNILSAAFKKI